MRYIDDKPNGIILNHTAEWNGAVRIAWYIPSERRDPGPTPPSLRECWCSGPDLVAGRFTPVSAADRQVLRTSEQPSRGVEVSEPPVNVITRAVALAVETYLRSKLARFLDDDLFIPRGTL
jgi:hypothetical protein